MIYHLEQQTRLTQNQYKVLLAGALLDLFNFFDFFLIGYVLTFIISSWDLSYRQSTLILLASSFGALPGSLIWGNLADRVGRRRVLVATIVNATLASGAMALVPHSGGWKFLVGLQFVFGFGAAGLHTVVIPLVQEFMPAAKRGWAGGMVGCGISLAAVLGGIFGAEMAPLVGGWRGLCVIGAVPVLSIGLVWAWLPESPRWLLANGRPERARQSLAWALNVAADQIDFTGAASELRQPSWFELFRYRRSCLLSCAIQCAYLTTGQGVALWSPALLMLVLRENPAQAAFLTIFIGFAGFAGRLACSPLSDRIGRRACGALACFAGALAIAGAGYFHSRWIGQVSVFWLLLLVHRFFSDGGQSIVQPYSAEVWPARLRASGMGLAYAAGNLGRVAGIFALGLIAGSSDLIKPQAGEPRIELTLLFVAGLLLTCGLIFVCFGFETNGRSLEQIDRALGARPASDPVPQAAEAPQPALLG